jgi:hypothetical protein
MYDRPWKMFSVLGGVSYIGPLGPSGLSSSSPLFLACSLGLQSLAWWHGCWGRPTARVCRNIRGSLPPYGRVSKHCFWVWERGHQDDKKLPFLFYEVYICFFMYSTQVLYHPAWIPWLLWKQSVYAQIDLIFLQRDEWQTLLFYHLFDVTLFWSKYF